MKEPWADWKVHEPTPNFADKVMDAIARDRPQARSWRAPAIVASLAVAAALGGMWVSQRPTSGAITADARKEVQLSSHVVAVLEPGASISWKGAHIDQRAGDVFYRVDKGTPLEVETALGSVTVGGTCFRVRLDSEEARKVEDMKYTSQAASLAVGIALTAIVYEGRVALASKNGKKIDLVAGEGARANAAGDLESVSEGAGAKLSRDPSRTPGAPGFDWGKAVAGYQKELAEVEERQAEVERELAEAKKALLKAGGDAGNGDRPEYDLSKDDWREMREKGQVKYQVPCDRKGWKPSSSDLAKLALAPEDGEAIAQVYSRSKDRLWSTIGPLCTKAIGSASAAEILGSDACTHLILNQENRQSASDAFDLVARIRAGEVAEPNGKERERLNPLAQTFLALTGEGKAFERDLADKFGADEAHRLAFDKNLCMGKSTFGGPRSEK